MLKLQELNIIKKIAVPLFHTAYCPQGNLKRAGVGTVRSAAHTQQRAETFASRAELYVAAEPPHAVCEAQVPNKFSQPWMQSQRHNLEQHREHMLYFPSSLEASADGLQIAMGSSGSKLFLSHLAFKYWAPRSKPDLCFISMFFPAVRKPLGDLRSVLELSSCSEPLRLRLQAF